MTLPDERALRDFIHASFLREFERAMDLIDLDYLGLPPRPRMVDEACARIRVGLADPVRDWRIT